MNEWINKYVNISNHSQTSRQLFKFLLLYYYSWMYNILRICTVWCLRTGIPYYLLLYQAKYLCIVEINKHLRNNKLVSPTLQGSQHLYFPKSLQDSWSGLQHGPSSLSLSPSRFAAVACQIIRSKSLFVSMLILSHSLKSYFARMFCITSSVVDISVVLIYQVSQDPPHQ